MVQLWAWVVASFRTLQICWRTQTIYIIVCNNSLDYTFGLHSWGPWFNSPFHHAQNVLGNPCIVIALHSEQQLCHTIARKLGATPSTISPIIECCKATWKLVDKGRFKHPHNLSQRDIGTWHNWCKITTKYYNKMWGGTLRGFKYHNFPYTIRITPKYQGLQ